MYMSNKKEMLTWTIGVSNNKTGLSKWSNFQILLIGSFLLLFIVNELRTPAYFSTYNVCRKNIRVLNSHISSFIYINSKTGIRHTIIDQHRIIVYLGAVDYHQKLCIRNVYVTQSFFPCMLMYVIQAQLKCQNFKCCIHKY